MIPKKKKNNKENIFVRLGALRPTYMETSPLPVKYLKLWTILGTNGHWEASALGFFSVILFLLTIGALLRIGTQNNTYKTPVNGNTEHIV